MMLSPQFTVHATDPVGAQYKDVTGVQRARWIEFVVTGDNSSATMVVFAPHEDTAGWLRETAASLRDLADTMLGAADKEEAA